MGSESLNIDSFLEDPVGLFRSSVMRRQDPGTVLANGAQGMSPQGMGCLTSIMQEGQQKSQLQGWGSRQSPRLTHMQINVLICQLLWEAVWRRCYGTQALELECLFWNSCAPTYYMTLGTTHAQVPLFVEGDNYSTTPWNPVRIQ